MGIEPLNKENFAYTYGQTSNLHDGRNANGSIYMGSFMEPTEYYLLGGMGLFTIGTQRKQLFKKPTWNGQQVSLGGYGKNWFKANFSSLSNFNNMEFIDTRVQQLEGMLQKGVKLPEGLKFTTKNGRKVKPLFEALSNAKSLQEFNALTKNKNYRRLVSHLKNSPEVLTALKNQAYTREVAQQFKAAQTTMRSGQSLPKGQIDVLHKRLAVARARNANFIKANGSFKSKTGARMSSGVKNAMAASKTMRRLSRGGGRLGGAVMIGLSAVNAGVETYSSYALAKELKPEQAGKIAAKQAGKSVAKAGMEMGGAWAGAKLGAMAGSFLGPVGTAVGGLVGGFVGWAAGSWLAKKTPVINESETDKMLKEQRIKNNEQIAEAVKNEDINVLATNISQFYETEEVKDEQGNIIEQLKVDENGEPIIKTVSEDKKQQLAFEERVKGLTDYVNAEAARLEEAEIARQQRAEQLRQEAEAARQEAERLRQEAQLARQEADYIHSQRTLAQTQTTVPAAGSGTGYFGTQRPSSYSFGSATTNQNGYNFGEGTTAATNYTQSYSWQNPAWQQSLGQKFDSQNFYAFNPNNYTMPLMFQQNKGYAA